MIGELADEERGIILVTGTTGSGKSTTLAAMIDRINAVQHKHIVTVEDPIEFLHTDKRSIINQREIGQDTGSFKRALRRVLRQDPDVILVGEMRDEETVATALSAAETGHLVLSTLHTLDAPETVNRIIDFFPPTCISRPARRHGGDPALDWPREGHDHEPGGDGTPDRGHLRGRVLRDADLRPGAARTRAGRTGLGGGRAFRSPHDFKLLVASGGQRSTSVDQLISA